jgi:hypothetical protein
MELRMSGQRKALATLNRPEFNASPSSESSSAGTSDGLRLDTLDFTVSNNVLGLVNLQIDEPYFTNDNRYYFSSPVRNAVSVLHLCDGRPNPFVQSVWKTDTFLEVRTASLREWPRLAVDSFSLVVLELKEQLQMGLITSLASWVRDGGGHLLILPVDEQSGNALGQLAQNLGSSLRPGPWKPVKAQMSNLEPGSDFLNNVIARKPDAGAMPSVEGYFPMPLLSGDEVLFKLENGDPLLKRFPWGQGMIYVSAVPAQERFTQWVRHDLFLPVFYRAALGSVRSGLLTGSLGNHVSWSLPIEATDGEALDWKLVARSMDDREMAQPMPNESNELSEGEQEGDPLEIRPEVRVLNGRICVRPGHAEIRPGFYDLVRQQGGTSNTVLAINANPEESDILPVDDDKLRALDPSILVSSGDQFVTHSGFQAGFFTGDGLKRLFLVACLVFLALEAVLLWQRKA